MGKKDSGSLKKITRKEKKEKKRAKKIASSKIIFGIIFERDGKSEEAINSFSRAITLDCENSEAYFYRGALFFKLRRYEEAIKDFKLAIEFALEDSIKQEYKQSLKVVKLEKIVYEMPKAVLDKVCELLKEDGEKEIVLDEKARETYTALISEVIEETTLTTFLKRNRNMSRNVDLITETTSEAITCFFVSEEKKQIGLPSNKKIISRIPVIEVKNNSEIENKVESAIIKGIHIIFQNKCKRLEQQTLETKETKQRQAPRPKERDIPLPKSKNRLRRKIRFFHGRFGRRR